jgi:hypothetical protein
MLRGGTVKTLYALHGAGRSIRGIARELGIARNTVRKYLRAPGVPPLAPRPRRPSKLDPYQVYPAAGGGRGRPLHGLGPRAAGPRLYR